MVYSRNRGRGGTYEYLVCAAHQHGQCSASNVRLQLVESILAGQMVSQRLPVGGDVKIQALLGPKLTVSRKVLRRSGRLWSQAPGPVRRALLTAFLQDIVLYNTPESSPSS